ncbi:MAG: Nif3-like dinuclear metal center hexameric protein [Gemmataceae bacterium]
MPTVASITGLLDRFAPPSLAADWDNVGLLLGDDRANVKRLMTCLTLTEAVVAEAVESHVEMIVTHHPIFFRPVQRVTTASQSTRHIWELAKSNIAVYSPHTAFDNTVHGINDILARRLEVRDAKPLRPKLAPAEYKIVVFVPASDLEAVSQGLFDAGAGRIGEYTECSYRLEGTGTFFGSEETNPTVGEKGRREFAPETRLETVCQKGNLAKAIAAIYKFHSYEEPAFDVYPLEPRASGIGEGRIGNLANATTLAEFAQRVRKELNASAVQVVGDFDRQVRKIAIACGAAGEYLKDAGRAKADVFLCGEMRFHDYLSAESQGISLVLPGHYASERPAVEELATLLQEEWPDLSVWASKKETDPVRHVME